MTTLLMGLLLGISHFGTAFVFAIFWRMDTNARWSGMWAIFHVCFGVSIALGYGGDALPVYQRVLQTLIFAVGLSTLLGGIVAITDRPVPPRLMAAGAAVLAAALLLVDNRPASIALLNLCYLGGAAVLWRYRSLFIRVAAVLLLVRAMANAAALLLAAQGDQTASFSLTFIVNTAVGLALLAAALLDYSRRVAVAQAEMAYANTQLSDLAVQLERRNVDYAQALDRAEAASQAKSQFLANMNHELRTPLNAVIGYAELILLKPQPEERARTLDYVANIRDAGRHLLAVVDDVIDLSRVDFQTLDLDRRTVSITDLVDGTVRIVRVIAEEKHQRIEVGVDPGLTAQLDERLIRQALLNLLGNAVKFTPAHGLIRIDARRVTGDMLRLAVVDSGPGVAPEDRVNVFEPFWQRADALTRGHRGLGLGLSIAQRFVLLHGGSIRVDGAADGGAAFIIELPLNETPAPAAQGAAEPVK